MTAASPAKRVGARSRAEIPPDVLRGLNDGALEAITLAELLAIDLPTLLAHALPATALEPAARDRVIAAARASAGLGYLGRLRAVGAALHSEAVPGVREELARARSDTVRELGAFMIMANPTLAPEARLRATRPYAADPHMNVREAAWYTLRPYVVADPDTWLLLLESWARDPDANVRRAAVEGTRPRAVWAPQLPELVRAPERGLPLLEPNRAHPSRYVQTAVANWLNDASKSTPGWVVETCERWTRESPCRETAWIVNHATRTLRRAAAGPANPGGQGRGRTPRGARPRDEKP